jgi:hypothetical protein
MKMLMEYKKRLPTPCKKNCWQKPTYENPRGFSWFAFYLLALALKPRNFPYTNTLAFIDERTQNKNYGRIKIAFFWTK